MKKIALFLFLIFSLSFSTVAAEIEESSLEPRASYVFSSVASTISRSAYGGDCSLTTVGSGTMTIYLQKKLESNNSWLTVDGSKASKTFSETSVCAFAKSKLLSAGTYRCKTYVVAYVNGYTDRRTVYSPELTIIPN